MDHRSKGLFNLLKYHHSVKGTDVYEHLTAREDWKEFCKGLDRALRQANTPNEAWLIGSSVYLPRLSSEAAPADWDVLHGDSEPSVNRLVAPDFGPGWHGNTNEFGYPVALKEDSIRVDLVDSRAMIGADRFNATHPVVDYLSICPISPWAYVVNYHTGEAIELPEFGEAEAKGCIDVVNQQTFLQFVSANRELWRQKIGRISSTTGLAPSGEVLALLDLTTKQFKEYQID